MEIKQCRWCKKKLTEKNKATYKISSLNDQLTYCKECVNDFRNKYLPFVAKKTAPKIVPKLSDDQKKEAINKSTKKLRRMGYTPEQIEQGLKEAGLK
jgi:hypothetical protein